MKTSAGNIWLKIFLIGRRRSELLPVDSQATAKGTLQMIVRIVSEHRLVIESGCKFVLVKTIHVWLFCPFYLHKTIGSRMFEGAKEPSFEVKSSVISFVNQKWWQDLKIKHTSATWRNWLKQRFLLTFSAFKRQWVKTARCEYVQTPHLCVGFSLHDKKQLQRQNDK